MRAKEFLNELGIDSGKPGDTLGQRYGGLIDPTKINPNIKSRLISVDRKEIGAAQQAQDQAVADKLASYSSKAAANIGPKPQVGTPPQKDTQQPPGKKYDTTGATDIDFREVPKTSATVPTTAPAASPTAPASATPSQNPTTTPIAQKAAAAATSQTTAPTAPTLGTPSADADSQQKLASLAKSAYPQQKAPTGKPTGFLAGVSQGFKQGMGGRDGETYAQLAARKAAGGLGLNATSQAIGSLPKAGTKIKDPQLGDIEVLPTDPAHNNMMAVKTKDGRKLFVDPKDL